MFRLIQHQIEPACSDDLSQLLVWLRIGLITSIALSCSSSGAIAQPILPSQLPFLLAQSIENSASYSVLHVNPVTGNDGTGDGSDRAPFKTITQALQIAQPNSIIQLAPGTYSVATGEVFPITLRPRITIQGNPENRGQDVVIQGGGWFSGPSSARRSITILGGANQSTLTGVTITNPTGYGLQIEFSSPTLTDNTFQGNGEGGIVVTGNSAPLIRNNFFYKNEVVGIRVQNTARPSLQNNVFEQTGTAITVSDRAIPIITGNRITQNKNAIVLQDQAQPSLSDNSIENNDQNDLIKPPPVARSPQNPATPAIAFGSQLPGEMAALPSPVPKAKPPIQQPVASRPMATPIPVQPLPPANKPFTSTVAIATPNSVTAASFPVPGNSGQPVQSETSSAASRPIQVVRLTSSSQLADAKPPLAPPSSAESPEVTVVVKQAKSRSPIPAPSPKATTAAALQTQEVTSRRPIRVPVPSSKAARPETSASPTATSLAANPFATEAERTASIAIPVPPPESGSVKSVPSTGSNSMAVSLPSQRPQQPPTILPVPSSDIPLGNIGGMPKVYTTGGYTSASTKSLSSVAATSRTIAVRYRVVVAATDDTQQTQVRSIAPDAFSISYQGRSMMQAGAFSDRSKADQLMNTLVNQGLAASVEAME